VNKAPVIALRAPRRMEFDWSASSRFSLRRIGALTR
jgi:hypothetical protein